MRFDDNSVVVGDNFCTLASNTNITSRGDDKNMVTRVLSTNTKPDVQYTASINHMGSFY